MPPVNYEKLNFTCNYQIYVI